MFGRRETRAVSLFAGYLFRSGAGVMPGSERKWFRAADETVAFMVFGPSSCFCQCRAILPFAKPHLLVFSGWPFLFGSLQTKFRIAGGFARSNRGNDLAPDIRSGRFSALSRDAAHGCDRGRIHSHLERCATADILPAVFQGTVRSAAAGFHLVCVVLHKEHVELVVARSRADGDGCFHTDHSLWLADG